MARLLESEPVGGRPLALEQAGGAQQQRAGADRGRPLGRSLDLAQPGEHGLVLEQRVAAAPAGDEHDVGLAGLVEGVVDGQAEAAFGADLARAQTDEVDLPAGHAAEHLVGTDGVLGGELLEEEDRDLHGSILAAAPLLSSGRIANVR